VIFSVQISQEIIKLRKIGKRDLHITLKVLPNEIIKNILPYPFNKEISIESVNSPPEFLQNNHEQNASQSSSKPEVSNEAGPAYKSTPCGFQMKKTKLPKFYGDRIKIFEKRRDNISTYLSERKAT
jgi:hypothetical protein